jgi:transposase-like protein
VAIVWPCALSVDAYVAAGRALVVPRPDCPRCGESMTFWAGYERDVRERGRYLKLFVRRARCRSCAQTHALLPAFVFLRRLDVVETVGAVLQAVIGGPGGVRPAAARVDVPETTAREWVRCFRRRAEGAAVSFAALAVELGAGAVRQRPRDRERRRPRGRRDGRHEALAAQRATD